VPEQTKQLLQVAPVQIVERSLHTEKPHQLRFADEAHAEGRNQAYGGQRFDKVPSGILFPLRVGELVKAAVRGVEP